MALDANDSTVYNLLNDKMYSIPENQRQYVWNQNNWVELLEDIKLVIEEKTHSHFIGSIVLKEEIIDDGIKNHLSIIDGQQRISTLTIILCAIGLLFAEMDERGHFDGMRKNMLVKDLQYNDHPILSYNANKDIANLVSNLIDNATMRFDANMPMITVSELISISKLHNKNIKDCFEFFYYNLKTEVANDKNKLTSYFKAIQDIKYINIVAKNDEDAFTIFEILNARGQPLKDFELLRNYLLKNADLSEKETVKECLSTIEDYLGKDIELFLKHYAMHKYGEKTDKAEKRPYKIITSREKGNDKKILLQDLLKKACYYNKITTYNNCSELEKKIFSFFKPRRQQQFRPIVLSLMHQLELGIISQTEYDEAIKFLYEFFIYFNVIGEQTSNKIEDIVYKYAANIENDFTEDTIKNMKKSMSRRIPNRENFYSSIKNVKYSSHWEAFSGSKKAENVRAIFEILERENGFKGEFDDGIYNIEHILSDALTENNAAIGNLMIIERTINDKCKNKKLAEKVILYKDSDLFLPKQISDHPDNFDVETRTKWISDTLYNYIEELKA